MKFNIGMIWWLIKKVVGIVDEGHELGYWETGPNGEKVWVPGKKPADPKDVS